MNFFSRTKEMPGVAVILSGGLTIMGLGLVTIIHFGSLAGIIFLLIGCFYFIDGIKILMAFRENNQVEKAIQKLKEK